MCFMREMRSMMSHVIKASWVEKPRFIIWSDGEGRGRLRHILMKQDLKLRDSDHMIVNRGRKIRITYNDCLWKRKKTTRLILFLFFKPLLSITLRDVMAWLFTELTMTTRSIRSRRWNTRSSQNNIQRRYVMVKTSILFKNKFLDSSIKWRKRRATKESSSSRFKVLTKTHHKLREVTTILVLGKEFDVFSILEW